MRLAHTSGRHANQCIQLIFHKFQYFFIANNSGSYPKSVHKVTGYINQQILGGDCEEAHREGQGGVHGICGFREGIYDNVNRQKLWKVLEELVLKEYYYKQFRHWMRMERQE